MKTNVNGTVRTFDAGAHDTAVDVLRDALDLTGTKLVCGQGVCGACTVLLDGEAVCACLVPASRLEGREVQTVEAHGRDRLHPVQKGLMMHDGLQCGYCTPGFVNAGIAFFDAWRAKNGTKRPSRDDVAEALCGNLCRCGAYEGIHRGIAAACAGEFDPDELEAGVPLKPARIDADMRVTGQARYTTDIKRPHMLHAAVLRSTEAHAKVLAIDLSRVRAAGAVALDVLDDPERTVRHVGQCVAAVAAETRAEAKRLLGLIEVRYERLPAVIDPRESRVGKAEPSFRKHGAGSSTGTTVFPGRWQGNARTNLLNLTNTRGRTARKRVAQASAAADPHLLDTSYSAGGHAHTPLEPHGWIAEWDGDDLLLHASSQGSNVLRAQVAKARRLSESNVRVHCEYVGGGFGSKGNMMLETLIAVDLARAAKRPVALILDRQEVIGYAGHRGGADGEVKLLSDDGHALRALEIDVWEDLGHCVGGTTALMTGLYYAGAPQSLASHDVVTHAPKAKEFRGPGGITGAFMLESAVDEMAWKLEADPIDLRRSWDPHGHDAALYDRLAAVPEWRDRAPRPAASNGTVKRGIGTAMGHWMHLYNPKTEARVELTRDGVRVVSGVQDQGQGTRSVIAQAVCDVTGWGLNDRRIAVSIGRSADVRSPMSGGSQVSASVFAPVREATRAACEELAKRLGLHDPTFGPDGIGHAGGTVAWDAALATLDEPIAVERKRGRDRKGDGWKSLVDADGRGLSMGLTPSSMGITTEVEVDTETGQVRVTKVWAAVGAGRVFVPQTAESQIRGGIVMGIGYTLFEDRHLDPATGHVVTINLDDCHLPGIADVPPIAVTFDEEGFEHTLSGGVGIGEVSMVPVAASIANAVYHATGFRPRTAPIRPEHIVEGLYMPEAAE